MDTNTIITYLACIIFLFIFGRIFILPIKTILKLIGNSILGGILILGINWVGQLLNFHIGINLVTSIFKSLSICVNLYKEKYESFGTYYFIVVLAKFILI